jgi:hypothetical protein
MAFLDDGFDAGKSASDRKLDAGRFDDYNGRRLGADPEFLRFGIHQLCRAGRVQRREAQQILTAPAFTGTGAVAFPLRPNLSISCPLRNAGKASTSATSGALATAVFQPGAQIV